MTQILINRSDLPVGSGNSRLRAIDGATYAVTAGWSNTVQNSTYSDDFSMMEAIWTVGIYFPPALFVHCNVPDMGTYCPP